MVELEIFLHFLSLLVHRANVRYDSPVFSAKTLSFTGYVFFIALLVQQLQ